MAKYRQKNERVINTAFTRLLGNADKAIQAGMDRMAQAGLEYLLEAHQQHAMFMSHTVETNTLAYVVAHNGTIVVAKSHEGSDKDLPGEAVAKAERIASQRPGWVAIILSDMMGWYRVDYEIGFLQYAADEVKSNFHRFFKRAE